MKGFLRGFIYAWNGIRVALREQRNLKVQSACAVLAVSGGFYVNITLSEWLALVIIIALVLSLELMNTALEDLVNLVTRERNSLAGKIKDIAAGAVLMASVASVVIGWLIFGEHILKLF